MGKICVADAYLLIKLYQVVRNIAGTSQGRTQAVRTYSVRLLRTTAPSHSQQRRPDLGQWFQLLRWIGGRCPSRGPQAAEGSPPIWLPGPFRTEVNGCGLRLQFSALRRKSPAASREAIHRIRRHEAQGRPPCR